MDIVKISLLGGVVFNVTLVVFIIFHVRRASAKQRDLAITRRQQMLEQGKIITAQEKQMKSKQELLKEKEELLKLYRKLNG
jgi:hypothetical protein